MIETTKMKFVKPLLTTPNGIQIDANNQATKSAYTMFLM